MTDHTTAHDLGTSAGGRAYIAEYFATQLRRHDFARYIENTLAADFACALALHLSKLRAPVADEKGQPTAPDDDAIAECWISASDIDGIAYDGPSFERGYRAALASAPVAELALAIHWPDCWDTAAYPTLESALSGLAEHFRCTNQDTHHTITTDADTGDLGDPSALAALADGLESIAGNENAALAAAYIRREADRLASAPVAGEAVAEVQIDPHSPPDDERAIIVPLVDFEAVDAGTKLYAAPQARPSDDDLWDQTLAERDEYHDMADKLANAIADHLLVEIGEHSSNNCPWMRALETIENAAPQASEAVRDALRSAAQQITDLYEGDEWPELAQVLHVLDALSAQPGAQKGGNDA